MDDGVLAYANKAEAATTSELKLAKQLLLSDVRNINSLVERVTYSESTDALTSMSSVDSFEK